MINFKVRAKNKLFWVSLISALFLVIGQTPLAAYIPVWLTESFLQNILSIFVILGIINDPTTSNGSFGLGDSEQALEYLKPKQDNK